MIEYFVAVITVYVAATVVVSCVIGIWNAMDRNYNKRAAELRATKRSLGKDSKSDQFNNAS